MVFGSPKISRNNTEKCRVSHPVSPNDNIFHNHSALSKPRSGPGYNTILLFSSADLI